MTPTIYKTKSLIKKYKDRIKLYNKYIKDIKKLSEKLRKEYRGKIFKKTIERFAKRDKKRYSKYAKIIKQAEKNIKYYSKKLELEKEIEKLKNRKRKTEKVKKEIKKLKQKYKQIRLRKTKINKPKINKPQIRVEDLEKLDNRKIELQNKYNVLLTGQDSLDKGIRQALIMSNIDIDNLEEIERIFGVQGLSYEDVKDIIQREYKDLSEFFPSDDDAPFDGQEFMKRISEVVEIARTDYGR